MMLPFKLRRMGNLDLLVSEVPGVSGRRGARMIVTTRRGGTSFGRGDLNLSSGSGDDHQAVLHNRNTLFAALGISADEVAGLRQRHSADVVDVTERNWRQLARRELAGDGMVTSLTGRWLSVSIGDCLAILLFDPVKEVLALAHAGWAGTARRIAEEAVGKMEGDYGCRPSDMRALLSPCIRPPGYQVDGPVFDLFGRHWREWELRVSVVAVRWHLGDPAGLGAEHHVRVDAAGRTGGLPDRGVGAQRGAGG